MGNTVSSDTSTPREPVLHPAKLGPNGTRSFTAETRRRRASAEEHKPNSKPESAERAEETWAGAPRLGMRAATVRERLADRSVTFVVLALSAAMAFAQQAPPKQQRDLKIEKVETPTPAPGGFT